MRTEKGMLASSANLLMRFDADGKPEVLQESPGEITALAHARGATALAIDGKGVIIRGGLHDGREATGDEARRLSCVTALPSSTAIPCWWPTARPRCRRAPGAAI
ncbi:hypothetical protein ACVOMV_21875 [Mesorhizobium atlanticum]